MKICEFQSQVIQVMDCRHMPFAWRWCCKKTYVTCFFDLFCRFAFSLILHSFMHSTWWWLHTFLEFNLCFGKGSQFHTLSLLPPPKKSNEAPVKASSHKTNQFFHPSIVHSSGSYFQMFLFWVVVHYMFFYFHHYLGKASHFDEHIFRRGW